MLRRYRPEWSPLSLPAGGPLAWYRVDERTAQDALGTVAAAAIGDPAGYLSDRSGNGYHLTQAVGAACPTLAVGANGHLGLLFDGSDDVLSRVFAWPVVGGATLFAVMQWAGAAAFPDYNGIFGDTVSNAYQVCGEATTSQLYGGTYRVNGTATDEFAPTSTYKVVSLRNGAAIAGSGLQVGEEPWAASRRWDGIGMEFLVFPRLLAASEIVLVERMLGRRYGIVGAW